MKCKTTFLIAFICLFLTSSTSLSQPSLEIQMQKILDKGIRTYNVRGVSAAVIFPDEKLWTGVSGVSHDTVSIKPDMIFAIGSVTKNLVAALALKLVEENTLSLDDPLSKWLPHYPHVDNTITIRQLLNHTSGLYMFWDNQQIWDDLKKDRTKFWTPREVLSYIKEPEFPPGEGWRYSNTNYLLMAMIIEKATGSTLSTEFKKRFWEPLGISNVYLSQQQEIPDHQVHVFGDNFIFGNSETDLTFLPRASHESIGFGSSGLFTSAKNLAYWCHTLFTGKILNEQSMREMLEFVPFRPIANMRAYGLGAQLYDKRFSSGKKAIGHGGGNIGTTTYMVYLPDSNVSIVVMINAFPNKAADYITKGLIRTILRDQKEIGIIPYFPFFPTGFILTCFLCSIVFITISIAKHRKIKKALS